MLPVPGAQQTIDNDQYKGNPRPFVRINRPEEIVSRRPVEIDGSQQIAVGIVDGIENVSCFHADSILSAKLIIFLCFVADVRFNLYLC